MLLAALLRPWLVGALMRAGWRLMWKPAPVQLWWTWGGPPHPAPLALLDTGSIANHVNKSNFHT